MKDFADFNSKKLSSYQGLNTKKASGNHLLKDSVERNSSRTKSSPDADQHIAEQPESTVDESEYVGTDEEENDKPYGNNSDALDEIRNQMAVALIYSKECQ